MGGLHAHDDDQGDDHGHGHGHGHGHHATQRGRRALGVAFAVTALFCGVEATAGFFTHSLALVSDATHMLTDALGLLVAFVAASMGLRPRGGRSTFGMRRVPVLGGLFNAILVLAASAFIVVEAVERLGAPRDIDGVPVMIVAALGLLVNLAGAWMMHRSGDHSVNMRGAMLHMLGDALGSVAALVSGAILFAGGDAIVDPIASLVVAGIITVGAVRLLFDVSSILLERAPAHVDMRAVEDVAKRARGVQSVVGLHAWELDSGEAVASLVLVTCENDLKALATIADELRASLLAQFRIAHTTIEWRPTDDPRGCCPPAADDAHRHAEHHHPHDHHHVHAREGHA
jgi:cobalt-zinc-cadmium efflux system protein